MKRRKEKKRNFRKLLEPFYTPETTPSFSLKKGCHDFRSRSAYRGEEFPRDSFLIKTKKNLFFSSNFLVLKTNLVISYLELSCFTYIFFFAIKNERNLNFLPERGEERPRFERGREFEAGGGRRPCGTPSANKKWLKLRGYALACPKTHGVSLSPVKYSFHNAFAAPA